MLFTSYLLQWQQNIPGAPETNTGVKEGQVPPWEPEMAAREPGRHASEKMGDRFPFHKLPDLLCRSLHGDIGGTEG